MQVLFLFPPQPCSLQVFEHAYRKPFILHGFENVGLKAESKLNRSKLLVDRAAEIMKRNVPKADVAIETPEGEAVLQIPYTLPTTMASCGACGENTGTHLPFCGHCGSKNSAYSAEMAAVHKGAKSGGYAKQKDFFDVSKVLNTMPNEEKQTRFAFCGDLLTEMRKRKSKSESVEHPAKKCHAAQSEKHSQPLQDSDKVCAQSSKPEQPKDVLTEVQSETDSDREDYDLESMEDATKYMLAHWPKKDRESCRPVVAFFLEELKRESCKTKPFSSLITLKIINPGQLNSKKGRSTFLSAWRANRAKRYAPKPKVH